MLKASALYEIDRIAIGGGVSANSSIRNKFKKLENRGYAIHIPAFDYCTDNAAMIGIVGYYKYLKQEFSNETSISKSRFPIA